MASPTALVKLCGPIPAAATTADTPSLPTASSSSALGGNTTTAIPLTTIVNATSASTSTTSKGPTTESASSGRDEHVEVPLCVVYCPLCDHPIEDRTWICGRPLENLHDLACLDKL